MAICGLLSWRISCFKCGKATCALTEAQEGCLTNYHTDNPGSDIAGANAVSCSSVLVHTGVYDPSVPPILTSTHQAPNVFEAVKRALNTYGSL